MAKKAAEWLCEAYAELDIPEDLTCWEDYLYYLEMGGYVEAVALEGEWESLGRFEFAAEDWLAGQQLSHDANYLIYHHDLAGRPDCLLFWLCDEDLLAYNSYILALGLYYMSAWEHDFRLAIRTDCCRDIPDLFAGFRSHVRELRISFPEVVGLVYLPKSIGTLHNLESLHVMAPLGRCPGWLNQLTALRSLWLMDCRFRKPHPALFGLSQLQELRLSYSNLHVLPAEIGQLSNLIELDLEFTRIESLPEELAQLKKLQRLELGYTPLSQIPAWLCHLPKLRHLDLSACWLDNLPPQILDLGLPFYIHHTNDDGIILDDVQLQEMDVTMFFHKTPEELRLYYQELEGGEVSTDEVRVIFIGNGDAGKTTIINRLLTGEFVPNAGQTKGVAIRPWPVRITDGEQTRSVTLNIWDFGGQEIMHSMHSYFMGERCLYVIVLDGRKDEEPEAWLDLVSQYGQQSPVMLVMNKIDDNANAEIDRGKIESLYKERFPSLSYHYLSCKKGTRFRDFEERLLATVARTESYKMRFPLTWNRVRLALKDMDGNYLSEREYLALCEREGVQEADAQRLLLRWLNDFGVCFSYHSPHHHGVVEDTKVLRPEWITNGIYKIINSRQAQEANGFLTHRQIVDILQQEDGENPLYHNMERDFILDMMRDFAYSYAIGDREFFPMLTAKTQPRLPREFFAETALQYQFHYQSLLPSAIFYNFIVCLREDVDTGLTWRRGVVLQHEDCRALARFGKDNHVLELAVCGPHEQACAYLNLLIQQIRRLQRSIRIEHQEYVRYRGALVDVDRSLQMLLQGYEQDYITELQGSVPLVEVLRSYRPQTVIDLLSAQPEQPREWQEMLRRMEDVDRRMEDMQQLLVALQGGQTELLLQIQSWLEQAQPARVRQLLAEFQQQAAQAQEQEILGKLAELQQLLAEKSSKRAGPVLLEVLNQCANVATLAPLVGKFLQSIPGLLTMLG